MCLSRRDLGTALSYRRVKPLRAEVVVNRGGRPVGTVPPYRNTQPSGTTSRETREAAKCETHTVVLLCLCGFVACCAMLRCGCSVSVAG